MCVLVYVCVGVCIFVCVCVGVWGTVGNTFTNDVLHKAFPSYLGVWDPVGKRTSV